MTFKIKKIAILGAGSIGGWLGARLSRCAGVQISVLARGATLAAVQQQGLVLHSAAGQLTAPVMAASQAAELGVQDVVILAVKSQSVSEVAGQIVPMLGAHTLLLSCMNGVPWWFFQGFGGALEGSSLRSVDPTGQIAAQIPAACIGGAVVHASCRTRSPGVIEHHFGNGLIIGEPAGGSSPRMQALLALLQEAGFEASLSPQIQKDIWYKLWGNMTVNPISAITGASTDRIMADPLLRGFITAIMLEAKAIGQRIGIRIEQEPQDRHQVTAKLGAFKTSMLQDVLAQRSLELDALVSAVQEIGALVKLPTPYTDALLGMTRVFAQTRGLYPIHELSLHQIGGRCDEDKGDSGRKRAA